MINWFPPNLERGSSKSKILSSQQCGKQLFFNENFASPASDTN